MIGKPILIIFTLTSIEDKIINLVYYNECYNTKMSYYFFFFDFNT